MNKQFILCIILFWGFAPQLCAQCQSSCSGSNSFFGRSAGSSNTTGSDNSFFGRSAGFSNTTGRANSFFGRSAGFSNTTGNNNSFFGRSAGFSNTTGRSNSFFGIFAGSSNTTGDSNSFFGTVAGQSNTTGGDNSFFGQAAGESNTTGGGNSFFGAVAGASNTTGSRNSFFGQEAGLGNTTGNENAFFGRFSGRLNNSGNANAFFGRSAGEAHTTGDANAFFGKEAGRNNIEGSGNVFLGHQAGFHEPGSNKLYIANDNTDSPLIYGEFDNKIVNINGQLGIGIDKPERPIHLRAENAIFRIDRDRDDPGFAIVRYDRGFNNVLKSFYFYNHAQSTNNGKFVIADWDTRVSGLSTPRLIIDNAGNIGIGARFQNLNNDATARLHVDGTVRFENLPAGEGQPLVIDAQGNISIAAQSKASHTNLSQENEALRNRVEKLEKELDNLKKSLNITHEESPGLSAQLFQNHPNPFDQSTVIPYYLSEGVTNAQILISDLQGREIKRLPIQQLGKGQVEVQADALQKGIYLYTLIVDGQLMESKRMLID